MDELLSVKEILKNNHLFLTGGGGVGKSYLTSKIIEDYKKENKQVIILGSTGISAVNIGGQTIHSFFAFGICKDSEELLRHDRYSKQRLKELNKILTDTDLLIIDEISMVSAHMMEMIRYRLNGAAYKGSLLFVGDFFQLPPINKTDDFSLFADEIYAFESSAWKNYNPVMVELKTSKRTDDKHFFEILKKIRVGGVESETLNFLDNLRTNKSVYEKNPTILFGRNAEADRMNQLRLNEIKSELYRLNAKETLHDKSLHVKRLESWHKMLNVPKELELKIGAHVIFCTNKWGKYYNGEQGVVKDIGDDYVLVLKNDSLVKVERHEFTFSESVFEGGETKNKPLASLFQYPLKLSYAITIHKSQGMSIENLVCDIHNIFETSQFYVAISRAKSAKGLCLEYNRANFEAHVRRCVLVNNKVKEFYKNAKMESFD
ncbi:MAG: ATP-dependent RecD-like DNA helicase [Campylobacteraceae bacterium]